MKKISILFLLITMLCSCKVHWSTDEEYGQIYRLAWAKGYNAAYYHTPNPQQSLTIDSLVFIGLLKQ